MDTHMLTLVSCYQVCFSESDSSNTYSLAHFTKNKTVFTQSSLLVSTKCFKTSYSYLMGKEQLYAKEGLCLGKGMKKKNANVLHNVWISNWGLHENKTFLFGSYSAKESICFLSTILSKLEKRSNRNKKMQDVQSLENLLLPCISQRCVRNQNFVANITALQIEVSGSYDDITVGWCVANKLAHFKGLRHSVWQVLIIWPVVFCMQLESDM